MSRIVAAVQAGFRAGRSKIDQTLEARLCVVFYIQKGHYIVDRIVERTLHWSGHVPRMGSERLPAEAYAISVERENKEDIRRSGWTI